MTRTGIARAGLAAVALVSLASVASAQRRPINRTTLSGPLPSAPSLIVFITVDQMRADYLPRFAPQLTGGLGRLYRGGAVFTNAYQDHAITETAPGHSVTMSGRFPEHTGIVMNAQGVPDAQAPLLGGGGPGASPYRFRGSSLIDWLRIKDARSRALSVSRKDRGAILPLGRAHQSVFWYASDGRFTTSTYYADTLPTWVDLFNMRHSAQRYAGKEWDLLLPASDYPEPDSISNENNGRDFTFPHRFPTDPAQTARTFTEFPQMDSITAQLALAGVGAMDLGAGPQTDILAISFSTTDAIGHRYGPQSRELHDQIVRLDRYLGEMIDSLYHMRDSASIVFALTADHGVAPYPELHAAETHTQALRADIAPVVRAAQSALAAAGVPKQALSVEEGIVHIARDTVTRAGLKPDSIVNALAAALRKVKGIARVDRPADLAHADTVRDAVARRWVHMIPSDYPADLVISLAPYAYYSSTRMATHGTPNDYDAHVPEIFYGPWFKTGQYSQRALVADMAPTLAAVAHTTPIEKLDGRAHTEVIVAPKR